MRFPTPPRKFRRIILVPCLLIAIALVGLALVYARPTKALKEKAKAMPVAVANTTQATSSVPAEVELIDLRRTGFEPNEIKRPAGRFLLGVNNRTGLTDLSLMLLHQSGRSAAGKRLSKLKTWRQVVDLQPGRYVLREANHRDWVCHITITER